MAENETEMNPCKKLKTEHNRDNNGDNTVSELPETVPKAGSSLVIEGHCAEVNDINGTETKGSNNGKDKGDWSDDIDKDKEIEEKLRNEGDRDGDKDDEVLDGRDADVGSSRDVEMSDVESDVSALSDMDGLSGEDSWKAAAEPVGWVYRCMEDGVDPRSILRQVISDENDIPDLDDFTLWKLVVNLVSEPPPRNKLPDVNTLEDVMQLLHKCERIMVLTGAGVSVSCGIPDFRSRNGIYARLAVDFPDLPDPQAMFDIGYFKKDQRPFFKFAKEIYPGQFEPSRCHKFIQLIEEHGKLLRNYTQNIDTLEQVAGIKNVIQCHGSFATATCMECHHKCSSDDIKEDILNQVIPLCRRCDPRTPLSVMKPDIVFFGESLPEEFHHQMSVDKDNCDLLIVIGSSLKVRPVALIPNSLPAHVPQILINKEHLRNMNFDVELLGDCDIVIGEICRRLGEDWAKIASKESMTQIGMDELLTPSSSPKQQETKPDKFETKTDDTERNIGKDQDSNKKSGNDDKANADVKEKAESSATESNDKCLCKDTVNESKESANADSESTETGSVNEISNSAGNCVNTSQIETKTSEQEANKTTTADEMLDKEHTEQEANKTTTADKMLDKEHTEQEANKSTTADKMLDKEHTEQEANKSTTADKMLDKEHTEQEANKSTTADKMLDKERAQLDDTVDGQKNSAGTKTDSLGNETDNNNTSNNGKPGCSSGDKEKQGSTAEVSGSRRGWRSYRQNVATVLGANTFCFIPPYKYVFPEAEYFRWIKVDTESENDSDKDTTMDSSRELNQTGTTTESSAFDGEVIDLTSDDEEEKQLSKEVKDVPDKANTVKNLEIDTPSKDPTRSAQDSTAEIVID